MAGRIVVFHRLAAQEYRSATSWYRRKSPSAAERFRAAVDNAVERIAENPYRGTIFREPYRWIRTRRFPYVLYYEIDGPDRLLVYAVAHGRRRLGYWLRRPKH